VGVLHVCTKFCANIFIKYGELALQNSIWLLSAILDLLGEVVERPTKAYCKNFLLISVVMCARFNYLNILLFTLESLNHESKISFLEVFLGEHRCDPQKAHSCTE